MQEFTITATRGVKMQMTHTEGFTTIITDRSEKNFTSSLTTDGRERKGCTTTTLISRIRDMFRSSRTNSMDAHRSDTISSGLSEFHTTVSFPGTTFRISTTKDSGDGLTGLSVKALEP